MRNTQSLTWTLDPGPNGSGSFFVIRKMALDGYCIKLDFSELHELMRLLSICSNNLNQYAKRANTDGSIYREDIEDLRTRFDDLFRAGTRIVQTIEDLA